ncbi:MAG: zinc ABC transporter substrate-binding protein [Tannerellaceae bacterium]|jgi:zinc transport system substrate-binding protein|nr:zinc ABC transporter substrate-binding protein [Tannerellaceae bacterium]
MRGYFLLTTLASLLTFAGCTSQSEGDYIAVTIEPQQYFAEKIAGDKFAIHTVVPAGQSPEIYDPTPQQMIRVSKSRAYLQIGHIGFEQAWMQHIRDNNPMMQVFDLSEGFELIMDEDSHHPGGVDPHIWSCIGGARAIAGNTLKAFIAIDKDNEAYYRRNYNSIVAEIDETEAIIRQKLSHLANSAFIIYHPSLTYFAHEFDLLQLCIEADGKEPSPGQLKELVDEAREHHASVVFVQQEFDRKNAERIAEETSCRIVSINPLNYHWNKELISIAKALANE